MKRAMIASSSLPQKRQCPSIPKEPTAYPDILQYCKYGCACGFFAQRCEVCCWVIEMIQHVLFKDSCCIVLGYLSFIQVEQNGSDYTTCLLVSHSDALYYQGHTTVPKLPLEYPFSWLSTDQVVDGSPSCYIESELFLKRMEYRRSGNVIPQYTKYSMRERRGGYTVRAIRFKKGIRTLVMGVEETRSAGTTVMFDKIRELSGEWEVDTVWNDFFGFDIARYEKVFVNERNDGMRGEVTLGASLVFARCLNSVLEYCTEFDEHYNVLCNYIDLIGSDSMLDYGEGMEMRQRLWKGIVAEKRVSTRMLLQRNSPVSLKVYSARTLMMEGRFFLRKDPLFVFLLFSYGAYHSENDPMEHARRVYMRYKHWFPKLREDAVIPSGWDEIESSLVSVCFE